MTPAQAAKLDAERLALQAKIKAEEAKPYFHRHNYYVYEWRKRVREIGKMLRKAGQMTPP